jgi:hypothetical protein
MSIRYRADRALGCTIAVWDGDITGQDALEHVLRLAEDRDWPPGSLHLADLRTVATVSIPDPELVEVLFEGTTLAADIRIAVILRPDFVSTADARYDTAMGTMNAATFAELDAACEYLGLDPRDVAAVIEGLRHAP